MSDMMRNIAQTEASGEINKDMERGYLEANENMMSTHQHMSHGTSTTENVEQAFAEGMILHHQMAVDMAKKTS